MAIIKSGNNYKIIVDDEDFPILSRHNWYFNGKTVYCKLSNDGSRITMSISRIIMGPTYRKNTVWDHKDRNPLNNQKTNLRKASNQLNSINRNHSKRFRGTTKSTSSKRPYRSQITYKRSTIFLGNFITEIEAAKAYDEKAKILYGDDAILNFP